MKRATVCFLAVLLSIVLLCSCGKVPKAKTQEAQKLIDNLEVVKMVNRQEVDGIVLCGNNIHPEQKEPCEYCVQIEDKELLNKMHSIIKDISYSVETNDPAGIYDGGTFFPLYFIIDGEWVFIGVWHNELVFYDLESILEDSAERLKVEKELSAKMAKILFEYR